MRWLIRFIIIAVTGTAGIAAIKEHKVAGSIFFILSLTATISTLGDLGAFDLHNATGVIFSIMVAFITLTGG